MTDRTNSRSRWTDDRGQIVILTALSMVVLMGIAALSIDASFMYDKRNRLHAAADAAAKSAAIEVYRNSGISQAQLEAFADQQVTYHGFISTRLGGTTTVVVNRPPQPPGPFTGNNNYVEVIASEPTGTFFGVVLGLTSMTPGARAVAGTSSGPYCIYTLDGGLESFRIGNAVLNMPGCRIADNGYLHADNPGTTITALGIDIAQTCWGQNCPQSNQTENVTPAADPLAGLAAPTDPGSCAASTATVIVNPLTCDAIVVSGIATTLNPGKYRSIDATATGIDLTLLSGVYYITGPFRIGNNALGVNGSGVLLYFSGTGVGTCTALATAGCIIVGNGPKVTLSAQTSGAYNGILMFQNPNNQITASFDGNMGTYDFYNLSGAMYFPNADVSFRNGLNFTNDCTLFVAKTIWIDNGSGNFSNTCTAYGGSPILTVSIGQ